MARLRVIVVALIGCSLLSCATVGLQPVNPMMPAARAGLLPEHRIFYDALEGYGDWTLIEPFGYMFRPSVNFVAWRPYEEGFWVPSDIWGWVWVSSEPFGWATYHYGQWMYDRFQGWVWIPGIDWGPAWVSWQQADDYVGWAPLTPRGTNLGGVPGGGFTFVPMSQLPSTNLKSQIVPAELVAQMTAGARPVRNLIERDGVLINRGPKIDVVERATGPLTRVRLAEVGPTIGVRRGEGAAGRASITDDQLDETRRAAEAAAQQAKSITNEGASPPPSVSMVRALVVAPPTGRAPGRRGPGRGRNAPADSTAR
jgi:hypothetical protein